MGGPCAESFTAPSLRYFVCQTVGETDPTRAWSFPDEQMVHKGALEADQHTHIRRHCSCVSVKMLQLVIVAGSISSCIEEEGQQGRVRSPWAPRIMMMMKTYSNSSTHRAPAPHSSSPGPAHPALCTALPRSASTSGTLLMRIALLCWHSQSFRFYFMSLFLCVQEVFHCSCKCSNDH